MGQTHDGATAIAKTALHTISVGAVCLDHPDLPVADTYYIDAFLRFNRKLPVLIQLHRFQQPAL